MKLNAVGVSSRDFEKSVEFYSIIGFEFLDLKGGEEHIESQPVEGSAKLMIDSVEIMEDIIGEKPSPGNHSSFAVEFSGAGEIDSVAEKLGKAGFKIVKEPWDAPWGQRYCIVEDPDGYKVDLYAVLE